MSGEEKKFDAVPCVFRLFLFAATRLFKLFNSFLNFLIPFLIHRAPETAEIRKLERPLSGLVGYVVPHLARSSL